MASASMGPLTSDSPRFTLMCCKSKSGEKKIYFISDDRAYTEEFVKLMERYTHIVDPVAQLTFRKIKEIDDSVSYIESLQKRKDQFTNLLGRSYTLDHSDGFRFRVNIHGILPRTVRLFYGFHHIYANCHGAALVTSGVYPILSYAMHPQIPHLFGEHPHTMTKIPLKEIQTGDLVYLKNEDHSLVYLNRDLCFSTNGRGAPLEIHRVATVLKMYKYPSHVLENPNSTNQLIILRKKEKENCFEEMMPTVLEFFYAFPDIYNSPDPCVYAPIFNSVETRLREIVLRKLSESELSEPKKATIEMVYGGCRGVMPGNTLTLTSAEARKLFHAAAGRVAVSDAPRKSFECTLL